ncbi:hypothetical protein A1O1_03353 [Capronia coronata CBS 617.96]|uniref:PWWP domain-containing protein n=1 Tax=Capronia coronata CBS 617.96 TaxID=1182541 RepID=W9Z6V8_9EURO|nr:uncharacterized protein A1O1_03353 [Capronia coronata CBS 617.96]EXJ90254.1 hypothetical protein A1O1_03353 [Capronia coronata CBS 617.96]
MDAETEAPQTTVPVKVPEPEDKAPPTLAEPASGVVAEMSGALPADHEPASEPKPAESTDAATANGTAESTSEPPKEVVETTAEPAAEPEPETAPPATGDTEVKEAGEADVAQPETNGAPADKKGSSSRRKSSAGVPEHKGKKLNKKKSMPKMTNLDAKPGEYYFARLKSYPPWPAIICDEEMLPDILLNTRPVTTKKADGTYNEPYADGGKKVTDRTFPVMFLYTNEFAWIPNTDLAPLNPDDCKDVSEKGKSKSLLAAYEVAAEDHDLQYFKSMLDDHAAAIQAEIDAKEAREAEKAAKSDKKKRKSEAKIETEDVEMDDADPAPKKSSKKRKKEADSEDEESEKPAKTPKTTKIKLTTSKTPKTEEKKPKEKASKARSEKRKSKAATSDEEMVDAQPEPEEKPLDPAEARKAREREVLFLRHKLQKGFLSRDQAPQEEEMPQMSTFIKKLEGYTDLEVSVIRTTKINKVLKALIKLNTIPRDEEFQFRKRSIELLSQWNKILGSEPTDAEAGADKEGKASPATNGVHEEKSEDAATEKKDEPPAAADKPAETTEEKPAETEDDKAAKIAEEKPVDPEPDKPAETTEASAEPEKPADDQSKPTSAEESSKPEVGVSEAVDKAPESAEAAAEAADVVKATE